MASALSAGTPRREGRTRGSLASPALSECCAAEPRDRQGALPAATGARHACLRCRRARHRQGERARAACWQSRGRSSRGSVSPCSGIQARGSGCFDLMSSPRSCLPSCAAITSGGTARATPTASQLSRFHWAPGSSPSLTHSPPWSSPAPTESLLAGLARKSSCSNERETSSTRSAPARATPSQRRSVRQPAADSDGSTAPIAKPSSADHLCPGGPVWTWFLIPIAVAGPGAARRRRRGGGGGGGGGP